jgi:hypothetical protein
MFNVPGRWGEGLKLSLLVESPEYERSPRFRFPPCPGAILVFNLDARGCDGGTGRREVATHEADLVRRKRVSD